MLARRRRSRRLKGFCTVATDDGAGDRPDEASGTPRVYTIPPEVPFLEALARAILSGALPVPGGTSPRTVDLPTWTVLVPTRRAVRGLRDAFLSASEGEAMLLPHIRPIGDVDEDAGLLAPVPEPEGNAALALGLPPAIGALERRLVLTELVLEWSRAAARGGEPAMTPGQAATWAEDLARLMDSADTEDVDLASVKDLVGGDFAAHWQLTLDFLEILLEHWPAYLAERGLLAPYDRRNRLMRAHTDRLAASPPAAPIIAAGSTGTVPATAALLSVIARLPLGAVVLPGLDLALDKPSWESITEAPGHPEHPQFGIKQLLDRIGIDRSEVGVLGADRAPSPRARLISEVMRPARTSERWRTWLDEASDADMATAASGLHRIDAPSAQAEAEVVALILRRALEDPQATAALVTPDRALARRVSARLQKWDLRIDDSAGRPLGRTPPGAFVELAASVADSRFAAVPLMALLKHPLTRLGRSPAQVRAAARTLELAGLRRPFAGTGLEGLRETLARAHTERGEGTLRHPVYDRIADRDWETADALLADLARAFAPLDAVYADPEPVPFDALAAAHVAVAQDLARDETGSADRLWRGAEGEALALALAGLLESGARGPAIAARDYPELLAALIGGAVVRETAPAHPRAFIWGPLEARLLRPDVVVLGALNEESWPAIEQAGPWLSRPMLERLGLPAPERRIGLAAHDVAQLMGAAEVYLTRAERVEGAPTVPSRWLLRLDAVLAGSGAGKDLHQQQWLAWAAARDTVEPADPVPRPAPRPRAEARPKRLSVTRIEQWIANPYAIFARDILRLHKLDLLAGEPDAALRGSLIHGALHAFAEAHGGTLPHDIAAALWRFFQEELKELSANATVRAFWQPQFVRFARWFAATEPARREGVERVCPEISGTLVVPGTGFTLSARADRIDTDEAGIRAIYDYKTGGVPSARQVADLKAPQLPLEAAIAVAGGFAGLPAGAPAALRYIRVLGRGEDGEVIEVGAVDPAGLADRALVELGRLVTAFADEATPYAALRRPAFANSAAYRFDDYAHLARVAEWSVAGGAEE